MRVIQRAAAVVDGAAHALDLAIYQLWPRWGARRMATRHTYRMAAARRRFLEDRFSMRAFKGAESDRVDSNRWLTSRLSIDAALDWDLEEMRKRSEELYRSDTIGHSAIEGRVSNEIGTGLIPQSAVVAQPDQWDEERAKLIAARLEDVARRWSEAGVDRTGGESLTQVEKLACRTFAVTGECFLNLADVGRADKAIPLTVDVISSARIETPGELAGDPQVRMGVQYDSSGQVIGYHVLKTHPGEKQPDMEFEYIPRLDARGQPRMLHVFDPLFPAQSRGIPWLGAALQRIKDASDILEYEIIAKQVESCFAAFITGGDGVSPADIAAGASSETDSDGNRLEDIRPGMIEYMRQGEEVKFADPTRPGATFFPLIEFALRQIAAALNYPYELLANNFFRTTFSAGRLAMLAGRVGFRMRRKVLVEKMLVPIWKRIVFEAVLTGELDGLVDAATYTERPHLLEAVRWQEPGWSYIDPEKETKAHTLALASDIETLARVVGEQGGDLDSHLDQRLKEKKALLRHKLELRKLQQELEREFGLEPEDDETAEQQQRALVEALCQ